MNSILRQIVRKSGQFLAQNRYQTGLKPIQRWYSPSWGPNKTPIDRKDVEFRVIQSLGKHEKIDLNSLKLDSALKDLGFDSLDLIEVCVELEDEFKVEIQDQDMDKLLTVSAFIDLLIEILDKKPDLDKCPDIEFLEGMTMNRPIN